MTSRLRIVGLGAGGHAAVMIDAIRSSHAYDIVGLLDPRPELWNSEVDGVRVLGGDDLLATMRDISGAFIGLGGSHDNAPRARVYQMAAQSGIGVVSVCHPNAVISHAALIGKGAVVLAGACVNAGARLGDNVLVNTGAIVEHHCVVGDHAHISTGARLGGGVSIGEGAHVGIGAIVRQGITIGRHAVVAAGAVVVKDVPDDVVVAGVPAAELRR